MLIVYWPITINFRIGKQTSKPQTNYRCCLRFSYLVPYLLISRNTTTFHKYFWCSRFCEFHRKRQLEAIKIICRSEAGVVIKKKNETRVIAWIFPKPTIWSRQSKVLMTISYVLLQAVVPSPVKPLLQMHWKEPGKLMQVAFSWHWAMSSLHSSTSGHSEYDHIVLK